LTGVADAGAVAGTVVAAPPLATGVIVNAGPPATLGAIVSVGPAVATETDPIFGTVLGTATAFASASGAIAATSVTINQVTTVICTGLVPSLAVARALTDPFVLTPFDDETEVGLSVDLIADFLENEDADFHLQTFASDPLLGSGSATFNLEATTNLPGLSSLFELSVSLDSLGSPVVNFSSPLVSQPIFASDFILGTDNTYHLNADKRMFSIDFMVPAGTLGMFGGEEVGLILDSIQTSTSTITPVPEPSAGILAVLAAGLLFFVRRRPTRSCGLTAGSHADARGAAASG
jgi:hypothetical protein